MMSAREKIDKNILGEIKSLGNPPETVKETVLVLVAVVTGVKKSDEWINGVKAISDPGFVKLIQEHDGTVPSKAAPALKKYVATYKVEDVKSKSAAFIAEWLHELAGSGAAGRPLLPCQNPNRSHLDQIRAMFGVFCCDPLYYTGVDPKH